MRHSEEWHSTPCSPGMARTADPGWIFDEGHSHEDLVHERFGDREEEVMSLHYDLIRIAGIYYFDLNPNNIKFQ